MISLSEKEAFEDKQRSQSERKEMFDKLRKWDEGEVGCVMPVVKAECDRRDRGGGEITYTGVDPDGELRNCPDCGCEVAVDPQAGDGGKVIHVEAE